MGNIGVERGGVEIFNESGALTPLVFARLLLELHNIQFTGSLTLEKDEVTKTFYLNDGVLVRVRSSLMSETFARMLLKECKITDEQYIEAAQVMKDKGCRFGEALIEIKVFHPDELFYALKRHQIQKMAACYTWKDGRYKIERSEEYKEVIPGFKISPYVLLLIAVRQFQDHIEAANELSPYKEHYIRLKKSEIWQELNPYLTEFERYIVLSITGESQLLDLLRQFPENLEDLFKFVWFLNLVELIYLDKTYERVDTKEVILEPEMLADGAERQSEHNELLLDYLNLMDKNYYAILNVEPKASEKEIEEAYRKLSEKYNFEYVASIQDPVIVERAQELIAIIRQAYETLMDKDKRLIHDIEYGAMKKKAIEAMADREAEVQFATALNLLKKRVYRKAEEYIRKAIQINPKESLYYAYLGWVAFNNKELDSRERIKSAKQALEWALKINSSLPAAHYFKGLIAKIEGNEEDAEKCFLTALEYDPAYIEANKQLQLIFVRKIKDKIKTGQYQQMLSDLLKNEEEE
ncbi:MAG: hypothetical protein Kow0090_06840 [Myxococcota bacterium]